MDEYLLQQLQNLTLKHGTAARELVKHVGKGPFGKTYSIAQIGFHLGVLRKRGLIKCTMKHYVKPTYSTVRVWSRDNGS